MTKDAAAALIQAHIPGCSVLSVTVAGNDSSAIAAVTVMHGQWVETFAVKITSIDVRQMTEEEYEDGISIGGEDDSMRHCY